MVKSEKHEKSVVNGKKRAKPMVNSYMEIVVANSNPSQNRMGGSFPSAFSVSVEGGKTERLFEAKRWIGGVGS